MKCEIRNSPGMSNYFGGGYRGYGRYQWNIKYYGWENDNEIEMAQQWMLGDYHYKDNHFDSIDDLLGRKVKASIEGRSGGWFVIYDELTEEELKKVDEYIESSMKALPNFLKEERDFYKQCEEEQDRRKIESLLNEGAD